MGEDLVDEPFPAGARYRILERGEGGAFVKDPHIALRTGKKDSRERGKNIHCRLYAVHPADRTLHAAFYDCPVIETFAIAFFTNEKYW